MGEVDGDSSQILRRHIVQIAGDAPALLILELQQTGSQQLHRFIGRGQLCGTFYHPLLELRCGSLLVPDTSCLLQPECSLVRGDASEEPFNLCGEIGPLRSSHDDASGILQPKPEAHDRDLAWSDGIRNDAGLRAWFGGHPAPERVTDGTGLGRRTTLLGYTDQLDGRAIPRIAQPNIGKVQMQQTYQDVQQRVRNLGGRMATPDGRKRQHTEQASDAALKALDVIRLWVSLHGSRPPRVTGGSLSDCNIACPQGCLLLRIMYNAAQTGHGTQSLRHDWE